MTQGESPKNKGEYKNKQNKDWEGGNKEGSVQSVQSLSRVRLFTTP